MQTVNFLRIYSPRLIACLKARLGKCIDWQQIDKTSYLDAMAKSPVNSEDIITLMTKALTDKIDDSEIYMRGIDYSYYYEPIEE